MPWYEIPDPILSDMEWKTVSGINTSCKFGVVIQIGYLIENKHGGIWLGVGPKAAKQFMDLGEWKDKK